LDVEISSMSFFHANATGAEALFAHVTECAGVDNETLLIDYCGGTGVIAPSMANWTREVIGIDIDEEVIDNPRRNAQWNGIENTTLIVGKAEVELRPPLFERTAAGDKIACVVDPPRLGLQEKALKAIRCCPLIHRLVYISCQANSLV
jgi:23S rRNA (uracil1939-C5)-methyltransferase